MHAQNGQQEFTLPLNDREEVVRFAELKVALPRFVSREFVWKMVHRRATNLQALAALNALLLAEKERLEKRNAELRRLLEEADD